MLPMEQPTVICITPVKNESWILERFLRAASLWADHIVVADQQSTDDSRAIASSFNKVRVIDNTSDQYDEFHRSRLLIDAARTFPSPRLIIALDADEFLTPNIQQSETWNSMLSSAPGTLFKFRWANIDRSMTRYWLSGSTPFALMDDGSTLHGGAIHGYRIPYSPVARETTLNDIVVMHMQYTDWKRMRSKHRWYQCWEKIHTPEKSAVNVFRLYHHMLSIPPDQYIPLPQWWIDDYTKRGVNLKDLAADEYFWWDREILGFMEQRGAHYFSKQAIWDIDWSDIAKHFGIPSPDRFSDPRSLFEKAIHRWLLQSQSHVSRRTTVIADKILRSLFHW